MSISDRMRASAHQVSVPTHWLLYDCYRIDRTLHTSAFLLTLAIVFLCVAIFHIFLGCVDYCVYDADSATPQAVLSPSEVGFVINSRKTLGFSMNEIIYFLQFTK